MNDIYDLLHSFRGNQVDTAYAEKQLHTIPKTTSVNRVEFIVGMCKDKIVLDVGSHSGSLHSKIKEVAKRVYGVDKEYDGQSGYFGVDLDKSPNELPELSDVTLVVCGEVIEHLANTGNFLSAIQKYKCPVIITVPNAFGASGFHGVAKKGVENVNKDHVAWYSWKTLDTLVRRYGYEVRGFFWYNGDPNLAEGLIMVIEQPEEKEGDK